MNERNRLSHDLLDDLRTLDRQPNNSGTNTFPSITSHLQITSGVVRVDVPLWHMLNEKEYPYECAKCGLHYKNGSGRNDIITSKSAHAYGLAWFENVSEGNAITFREHKIMGETADENDYGVVFSQLHAMALVDMDRDGIKDLVTGKRYWAHNG